MASKSGRTPMAVDKSRTPPWMKVVIIVLAVSFGLAGVAVVAAGVGGSGPSESAPEDELADAHQQRVDAALAAVQADPDNPDIVIQAGHAYYDWAVALYESGQQQAAVPVWLAAVSYYDRTLALDPDNDIALGNKAFALYYAQDDGALDALNAFIAAASDNPELTTQVQNARELASTLQPAPATSAPTP